MQEQVSPSSSGPSSFMEEETGPAKTFILPSIQYIIYTDSKLEHYRKHYFELKKVGRGGKWKLSKELSCKLVRNTITNMLSIVRASEDFNRYPTKEDLQTMARWLVSYYPMLADKLDIARPWVCIFTATLGLSWCCCEYACLLKCFSSLVCVINSSLILMLMAIQFLFLVRTLLHSNYTKDCRTSGPQRNPKGLNQ